MVYATTIQLARYAGINKIVTDENVGTGDNSETDFDLDYTNILAGSYTLSAATSGSNTFTALTETTHFTLDKQSGRVLLTSTGVTALGTKVLYATYEYCDLFTDSTLSDFITSSDSEVEYLLGRKYNSTNSVSEYHDGRQNPAYPTTDTPYASDWDRPQSITLNCYPILKIDNIMFLQDAQSISLFYNYDASGPTYTDKTDDINDTITSSTTLFASTSGVGDIVYIGCSSMFLGITTNLSTVAVGGTIVWEYYNGTTWTTLTTTDGTSGAAAMTASGTFTYSMPSSWTKSSVNSSSDYYWLRGRLTAGFTTSPIATYIVLYDAIDEVLSVRDVKYNTAGVITFINKTIPNGVSNVRVDYSYGSSSTPALVTELSALLASLRIFTAVSGGSYNTVSSFNLGAKSFSMGEVHANVAGTILRYQNRINTIVDMLGKKYMLGAV